MASASVQKHPHKPAVKTPPPPSQECGGEPQRLPKEIETRAGPRILEQEVSDLYCTVLCCNLDTASE